jgi:hypothetical protein
MIQILEISQEEITPRGLTWCTGISIAPRFRRDIAAFAEREGIPANSKVLYANIVGGYNPATETEDDGRYRALLFHAKLKVSALEQFSATRVDLGSSKLVKPNLTVMRITLSGS